MAIPGFTAEQCLATPGAVSPQFLDFVKEAFESIGHEISSAAQSAASAVASAFSQLSSSASSAGQQFVCGSFVTSMMQCNGNSPAMAALQIAQQCLSRTQEVPEAAALCPGLGASIYALAQEYCKNPSQDITPFIQAACPNG